jgi:hypothetical protein
MEERTPARVLPGQDEYLIPGRNALETSLVLGQSWTRGGKPFMLIESVKRVLTTLEQNQIPYAIIGSLAAGHHAKPRLTQDVGLMFRDEDIGRVRSLFRECYQGEIAVLEVYEIGGTRFHFLPAKSRYQCAVIQNAVGGSIEGMPVPVASARDVVLLKMVAAPARESLASRRQDEADITAVLHMNKETMTAPDIRYVGDQLLELCSTVEDRTKRVQQLRWLNDTLVQLSMADCAYPLTE